MLAKKLGLMLVLVTLMVSLEACGPGGFNSRATPTPLPPVVNYEKAVFTVTRGSIVSEREIQSEIVPAKQDDLFFRASGFISRVVVKPGDMVKQGDLLAEMQVDDLLNQLQQSQIDLEVSQANLAKDKVQLEYEIGQAEADVFMWEQRVKLAEMDIKNTYGPQLERAEINLDMTKKELELAQKNLELNLPIQQYL
jgi:HlyD family secretion protein